MRLCRVTALFGLVLTARRRNKGGTRREKEGEIGYSVTRVEYLTILRLILLYSILILTDSIYQLGLELRVHHPIAIGVACDDTRCTECTECLVSSFDTACLRLQ